MLELLEHKGMFTLSNKKIAHFFLILTLCFPIMKTYSQESANPPPKDWFLLDRDQDKYPGISLELAYQEILKNMVSKKVVVAVIDGGVDIHHEDLQGSIWTNKDEIPDNGIDDDKNGYIDDVNGWNFIGGKDENVNEDTYEITREYARLKSKFDKLNTTQIPSNLKKEYKTYLDIKSRYENRKEGESKKYKDYSSQYELYNNIYSNFIKGIDTLKTILQKDKLFISDVKNVKSDDPNLLFYKGIILQMTQTAGQQDFDSLQIGLLDAINEIKEAVDYYDIVVNKGYNEQFNSRKIVGDQADNFNEKYYGNNDVIGPDASHGTHVSGIIAANRNNYIGVKGICDNVSIMPIRAVPNGDERDKDVANAIRYAVDNGAQVINMSFGKSYSPQKYLVDEAVKYAAQKGVIMVHASGNDSQNLDKQRDYPNRFYIEGKSDNNWIEVGASTWEADDHLIASFSNYGKKNVHFLAPGSEIYSTTPDNTYKSLSGTSMACPVTTGVVALLLSYFPNLTPAQVVKIAIESTVKYKNLKVILPKGADKVALKKLTLTGGIINSYLAVQMARGITTAK